MFTNLWFKILWRLEYKNHLQKIKKPTININENQLYRLLKKLKINLAWMNTQTISGDILMIITSCFPWNKKKVQVEFY